ncbi:MAG: glycine cleavage system protein GcvH [Opitutales bacterium]
MSDIPADLRYTKEHEWIKLLDDGTALVGVTDYAQESLGDVTFVELPPVDEHFGGGDTFGVVESVKAASDLFMPVAGTVVEVNEALDGAPELVNQSPYAEAWIIRLRPDDPAAIEALLDAAAYGEFTG